jgi:hypothetical protein
MFRLLLCGFVSVLTAGYAGAADDVVSAVAGSIKTVDKGTKTAVVKTTDGTEHTLHFVGKTTAHGAEAGSKDALAGVKEGDQVVVHYTKKGAVETAQEVDHVGRDGLKTTVASVRDVDRGAKTVTVKTAEGADETYHLTGNAFRETGEGIDKTGKVTIYYTEDAGKKIAHFFATN